MPAAKRRGTRPSMRARKALKLPLSIRGRGNPTIITPDIVDEFERLLPTVAYIETVADLLGISRITWRTWVKWGRQEVMRLEKDSSAIPVPHLSLYVDFYYAFKRGMAAYQARNLHNISERAPDQWQASAWLLERRFPEKYGDQRHEIAEIKKQVAELEKGLVKTTLATTPPTSAVPAVETPIEDGAIPQVKSGERPDGTV